MIKICQLKWAQNNKRFLTIAVPVLSERPTQIKLPCNSVSLIYYVYVYI